jgi:DNA topoisomerase-1
MRNPRDIDEPLVDAYLARRALDYLVGFTLSPVLWRKLPGSRSAGRVQSVALRVVCDRESEIEKFRPQEYWSVGARLNEKGRSFEARLYSVDGKKTDKLDIGTGAEAEALKAAIDRGHVQCQRRRQETHQAQSLRAVQHLEPAAGCVLAPRLCPGAHHADRAAPL